MAVARDAFLVGKILSAAAAACGIRVAGGLLRKLFGTTAAIGGMLFLAANPQMASLSIRAVSDTLYFLLFAAALYFLFPTRPAREPAGGAGPDSDGGSMPMRNTALAGAFAGLAWLTRYNGIALLPAAAAVLLLCVRPAGRALRALVLFVAVWIVVALPWALYLKHETGDPLWNYNYKVVAAQVYGRTPELAEQGALVASVGFASPGEVFRADPGRVVRAMTRNLAGHAWRDARELTGPVWAAVCVLGVVLAFSAWRRRESIAFALAGICAYLSLVPAFYNPRFMLTLLIFWAAGAGGVAMAIERRFWRGRKRATKAAASGRFHVEWIVLAGFAAAAIAANAREIRLSTDPLSSRSGPEEILDLARKMKRSKIRIDETTPIAAHKPHAGYYLGGPVIPVPAGSLENLREKGAKFLLVSGAEVNWSRALQPLWLLKDRTQPPPPLSLVGRSVIRQVDGTVRAASLYAVRNPAPWNPPPHHPLQGARTGVGGLARLDSLRLRLVRWYLAWDPAENVAPLLAALARSAPNDPEVRLASGDAALSAGDGAGAGKIYAEIASARGTAGPDTSARRAELRLAGLRFLDGDPAGMRDALTGYARTDSTFQAALADSAAGMAGAPGTSAAARIAAAWSAIGFRALANGEPAMAIAPLAACAEASPAGALCVKHLGRALRGVGRQDLAERALRRYLAANPNDREATELLTPLPPRDR